MVKDGQRVPGGVVREQRNAGRCGGEGPVRERRDARAVREAGAGPRLPHGGQEHGADALPPPSRTHLEPVQVAAPAVETWLLTTTAAFV